jgi:hypothetical protein
MVPKKPVAELKLEPVVCLTVARKLPVFGLF